MHDDDRACLGRNRGPHGGRTRGPASDVPPCKMLRGRKRRDVQQHTFSDADVVKEAKDFVIDGDRPRPVIDVTHAIKREGADFVLSEQGRRDCARSPEADNRNLGGRETPAHH